MHRLGADVLATHAGMLISILPAPEHAVPMPREASGEEPRSDEGPTGGSQQREARGGRKRKHAPVVVGDDDDHA